MPVRTNRLGLLLLLVGMAALPTVGQVQPPETIREIPLHWPQPNGTRTNSGDALGVMGSTHEITWNQPDGKAIWVTGQNYDSIARITLDGKVAYFAMPPGSGPHGIRFDREGRLWVSLEFLGAVVRLDTNGKIVQQIDVRLHAQGAKIPINPHPHAIEFGPDGKALWFTGKKTGTVGKINPDGTVEHFELPTVGSVPIYLLAGPDGNMWCVELIGNKIARISYSGEVREFVIPTPNGRPIALVRAPDNQSLWFSEEAGNKVARIDMNGTITEYPVPRSNTNTLLAGITIDNQGNVWTQAYDIVGIKAGGEPDYLVRLDSALLRKSGGDLAGVPVTYYSVPTRQSMMHRIIQGPDGNLWFTEMGADRVGVLAPKREATSSNLSVRP